MEIIRKAIETKCLPELEPPAQASQPAFWSATERTDQQNSDDDLEMSSSTSNNDESHTMLLPLQMDNFPNVTISEVVTARTVILPSHDLSSARTCRQSIERCAEQCFRVPSRTIVRKNMASRSSIQSLYDTA